MKEITSRQFAIFSVLLLLGMKMLIFPSIIAQSAKHDSFFSIAISVGIELLILLPVVFLIKKNPDTTFMQLLTKKFGKLGAIIVMTLFILFFLTKLIYALQEEYSFLLNNMYSQLNWIFYFVPVMFLLIFLAAKGVRTVGRSCEIFFVFIVVTIVAMIFIETFDVNLATNLPLFEFGVAPMFEGVLKSSFWCGNSLLLLLLMGKINIQKAFVSKTMIYTSLAAAFLVGFMFIFTSLFDVTAAFFQFALVDITVVTPYISDLGTLDWVIIIMWNIALLLLSGILISVLALAIKDTYGFKNTTLPALILGGVCITISLINDCSFLNIIAIVTGDFIYVSLGFYALFLLITLLLFIKKQKRGKYEKNNIS